MTSIVGGRRRRANARWASVSGSGPSRSARARPARAESVLERGVQRFDARRATLGGRSRPLTSRVTSGARQRHAADVHDAAEDDEERRGVSRRGHPRGDQRCADPDEGDRHHRRRLRRRPTASCTNRQNGIPSARVVTQCAHRLDEHASRPRSRSRRRRCRPAARSRRAARLPAVQSIVYRRSVPARPSAISTSPFSVCSDWTIPTTAEDLDHRRRVSLHLGPSTTCTKSGRRRSRARRAPGSRPPPTSRVARIQMSAIRSRSSLHAARTPGRRPAAAAPRCVRTASGSRSWRVCTSPSAAAPSDPSDHDGADQRSARLPDHVLARRRCRRSRRGGAGWPSRTTNDGRHGVSTHSSTVEIARLGEQLRRRSPRRRSPSSAIVIPVTRADERRRDLAQLEPPELHLAHEQRHLRRAERADEKTEAEDATNSERTSGSP